VLHAVSPLDELALQRELGRLVEAELLYQRGLPPQATYTFKHALIQDAAYQSLLKSMRQQYHQRIAQVLEAQFPAIVDTQPELLAHHYTAAGRSAQAIPYWHQAGQQASQRSANAEAIAHLARGLEMLNTLPESPARLQQELDLLTTLGPVLVAARGQAATEVEHAYARARALCQQVGETTELFPVLFGLLQFYANRAEYRTAWDLAECLLALSHNTPDPLQRLVAHRSMGTIAYYLGEFRLACTHVEQAYALYMREQHHATAALYGQDLGVSCCTYAGLALLWLGYPAQALQRFEAALTLARALEHPYTLARALAHMAAFHHGRREVHAVQAQAEAAMILATEQGFPYWFAWGSIFRGWARAAQGQRAEGLTEMRQGLTAYRLTESALDWPRCLALLAEVHGKAGQADEGLRILGEALAAVATTEERFYEAELYRLQGELVMAMATDKQREAEACFQQALTVARQQEAKWLELRAAMSLARLWQQQGQRTAAYDLLAPIHSWFTEGFDTGDLQEAKALLEELA
jgi:predicted ATPase